MPTTVLPFRALKAALAATILSLATLGGPAPAPAVALKTATTMAAATTIATTAVQVSAAARWQWPLDAPRIILRPFIAPPTPFAAGHRGIDLVADPGATVRAAEDGIVHFAGLVVDRPVLSIRHSGALISSYEPVEPVVAEGETVNRGDVIGVLAPSTAGHCDISCLHLGARVRGQYISPMNFLGGIPRSVLLPTRSLG